MAKYVKYIFICLFAVFVMSHNTSAIDSTINLNDYEKIIPDISQYYDYSFSNSSHNCTQSYTCDFIPGDYLRGASTHQSYQLKKNDIVIYNIYLYQNSSTSTISNLINSQLTPGYNVRLLYIHEVLDNSYFMGNVSDLTGAMHVSKAYEVALTYAADGTYKLGSFNTNTNDMYMNTIASDPNNITQLKIALTGFTIYRYSGSNSNKEQAEATQDAADEASSSGSSSEASAEAATSSLISVIGGFVNVITNAQATNCKINMDTSQLQIGEIDLCANPVPSYVQIIGSLILICAVIPLAIILFNRFISLFRSFQG